MSILENTIAQKNFIHSEVAEYFDLIFGSDCLSMKGLVCICLKKREGSREVLVPVKFVPALQVGAYVREMHISTNCDYFYSRCQFKAPKLGQENAFCFNELGVDIDCHDAGNPSREELDWLCNLICSEAPNRGIQTPNIIVFSGRGLHFKWVFDQVPWTLGFIVKAVSQDFAGKTQEILNDYEVNAKFKVDKGYSSNVCGLTRIPGTFNTASKSYSDYEILNSKHLDLIRAFDSITPNKEFLGHTENFNLKGTQKIGMERVLSLKKLAEIRPIQVGQRDLFLLILFSAYHMAGYNDETAFKSTLKENAQFSNPLPEKEVRNLLSTSFRKHYFFRNSTIIELLGITEEEEKQISLHRAKEVDRNKARKERNLKKKKTRNRKILKLFLCGYAIPEIAKKSAVCYNSAKKVIDTYKDKLNDLFSEKEIKALRKKAAKRTVTRLKNAFQKMKTNLYTYTGEGKCSENNAQQEERDRLYAAFIKQYGIKQPYCAASPGP